MPKFEVPWQMFGTLTVEAVDENDAADLAEDLVMEALDGSWLEYDGIDVTGYVAAVPEGRSYEERDTFWDSESEGTTDAAV